VENLQDYFDQMKAQVTAAHRDAQGAGLRSALSQPAARAAAGGSDRRVGDPMRLDRSADLWRPLAPMEVIGQPTNEVTILSVDQASATQHRAKVLVQRRGSGYVPVRDLEMVLQQIFGVR